MARYDHLPIYRAAFDLAVHLEQIVRHFDRYSAVVALLGATMVVRGQVQVPQVPQVPPGSFLAWDQTAADLPTAQAYSYKYYANGVATGVPLASTCAGATSPYACSSTPRPLSASGTLVVTASNAIGESSPSPTLTFQIGTPPAAPTNLHIVPPGPPPPPLTGTLSQQFPGDVGIEASPDVVFVERFDEPTLSALFARYNQVKNGAGMSFTTDVPASSPVSHALDVSWIGGGVNDGGHLFKLLSPGVDDVLYVRYYIKYPTVGAYNHEGVWMGGYNPPLPYPFPRAGLKPSGSDLFSASAEASDNQTTFDAYDYWMDMHVAADGKYWGNSFINDPSVKAPNGVWTCVEHMVKLNTPVTASNGERAIWLNGVRVSYLGPGFPTGSWSWITFTPGAGAPFPGFRWRSTPALNLNYLWLDNYSPNDPAGLTSSIKFAHLVAAKRQIGCL